MEEPKTLQQAILYFADPDRCIAYLASSRWPDGVAVCPTCGRKDAAYVPSRRVWQCKTRHPKAQFSIKVGTIFEDSPIPLSKWLAAMWLIANCKNGISSWEIHRALKVTQKTAWFMMHRTRVALRGEHSAQMAGDVEADESWIGGAPKNRHKSKRQPLLALDGTGAVIQNPAFKAETGQGTKKTPVFGLLDREARQVRAKVIPQVNRAVLQNEILNSVSRGSRILTDENGAYTSLPKLQFVHETVNHVKEYVRGDVHTNGLENFWSLLKRGLRGTYIAVEPYHLDRYLDEQVFRYNNRATKDNPLDDGDRFALVVSQIIGRRLTYKELTGKTDARQGPEETAG
jgi:ISXO2-like transposase domain/Transposase zinc-ribbon domain